MNEDLKKRIEEFNKIKYPNDNSKRIIIGSLKYQYKSGTKWNNDKQTGHKPVNTKE